MVNAEVSRDAPQALHQQISRQLEHKITSGEWPAHYKLPAEPDLAQHLGVSRGTVRRALRTLVEQGHLTQVHGRGTFVLSTTIEQPIGQELMSLAEALDRQGLAFTTQVLSVEPISPPARLQALLNLAPGEKVLSLRRRRQVEGTVVAVLDNYVRYETQPELLDHDFATERLFAVIESAYQQPVGSAHRTFEAVAATPELAASLDVTSGTPLLYLEQITYLQDGRTVEYSNVWIRGDRLRLSSVLTHRPPRSSSARS